MKTIITVDVSQFVLEYVQRHFNSHTISKASNPLICSKPIVITCWLWHFIPIINSIRISFPIHTNSYAFQFISMARVHIQISNRSSTDCRHIPYQGERYALIYSSWYAINVIDAGPSTFVRYVRYFCCLLTTCAADDFDAIGKCHRHKPIDNILLSTGSNSSCIYCHSKG